MQTLTVQNKKLNRYIVSALVITNVAKGYIITDLFNQKQNISLPKSNHKWNKVLKNLDKVQQRYNDELEKLYKEDKNAYPCRFRSLTDFIIQYQDCIFTKKQMIDLLSRFDEVKNPKTRAENHKKRYGIEYFSQKDVQMAMEECT